MRTLESSFADRLAIDAWVAGSATRVPGGTLLRTPRFPVSWDLNQLVLDPGATDLSEAVELVERELAGADHRRITAPDPEPGLPVPDGWDVDELLVMLAPAVVPPWPPGVVRAEAADLRRWRVEMWHEHLGAAEDAEQLASMQEAFASFPGSTLVAVWAGDRAVAWAQVCGGCIDDVWVHPDRRGRGLGRAVTTAAMAAGGWYLWTDLGDPRPQGLYRSLGFADAGRVVQMTRRAA